MTDPEIADIHARLDHLAQAVEKTHSLVEAAYGRIDDGPGKLARARASDDWRLAYEESEPLVSVRIATKDRAELLVERALASVRRQTYSNWEAVVVGSACTDDTEARVAALGDPRIRFHNRPVDGPYPEHRTMRWFVAGSPSMNAAVEMARGRWIAPLDDDDEWDDDHLEVLLGAAREARAEFVYGRLRCRLRGAVMEGKEGGEWPPRSGEVNLGGAIYNAALREFRHDVNSWVLGEPHDWNLVRRMLEAGVRFRFVDRLVATYHADHVQQVYAERQRQIAEQEGSEDGESR